MALLAGMVLSPQLLAAFLRPPQGRASWLQVKGRLVVDERGRHYRIAGLLMRPCPVGAAGISGGDQQFQYGFMPAWGRPYDFALTARRLGFNAVVIEPEGPREKGHYHYPIERWPGGEKPFKVREHWMPYSWMLYPDPGDFVDEALLPVVKDIEEAGMYVIIDLHMGRWDLEAMYRWGLPFWRAVARRLKDDPYIACYIPYCETILWPKEAEEKGCDYFQTRKALIDALRRWYMDVLRSLRREGDRHIVVLSNWHGGYVPEATIDTWGCVNLHPDLPYNQVAFKMEVAWGPVIDRYQTAKRISLEYNVPIFVTHVEMGATWEDRAIAYDWLLNDPDPVGFFIAPHPAVEFMRNFSSCFRKLLKERASPPPPPRRPEGRDKVLLTLQAEEAEGGEAVSLREEDGRRVQARRVPEGGEPRSRYVFRFPKPLRMGIYEAEVRVWSDPSPAARQVIWWLDEKGEPIRNRTFAWGSGFEGFDWRYNNSIPVYVFGDGWHLHRFIFPAYQKVYGIAVERLEGTRPTRPIAWIRIREHRGVMKDEH